ncbi:phosphoribosyltransferase domain-containing protein [Clostridium sp. E02]|uniref:phosphoribosyltransferase domain-containing protein n=1 Tax=Clostridium sp. E02 TaxID=2487134 RepID=UPI000F533968|nr:phosphoribosyltransferase domain-containing protein [Clostridium sp. E02]
MYIENDLVRIAKRENNKARPYLVVNQLQGKHIPVLPSTAIHMFHQLGNLIKTDYKEEKLLMIGFAETATAIGAAIATQVGGYYIQTTREIIDDVDYLYFTESHSHATEQKLVKDDISLVIDKIDRIIFIEDEITTGNTIMNIIKLLKKEYQNRIKFSVASLLNGMNAEAKTIYEEHDITTHFLVKTSHDSYETKIETVEDNGIYHKPDCKIGSHTYQELVCVDYLNARRIVLGKDYLKACENLWMQIHNKIDLVQYKNILVLGTEEFMYPALFVAEQIEQLDKKVRFHATTRSPIVVSNDENYPLHVRYQLASVYKEDRTTFVYDLEQYDIVLIITDSTCNNRNGLYGMINALHMCGNSNIYYIRWCE